MGYFVITFFATGISYLLYCFFLKHEKSFLFNRFYLLGSMVLCLLAPTLQLQLNFGNNFQPVSKTELQEVTSTLFFEEIPKAQTRTLAKLERETNWLAQILWNVYFMVSGLFLFRFFKNLIQLLFRIKINKAIQIEGLRIIPIKEKSNPHSFFHFLFINRKDFNKRNFSKVVIEHELAHSMQFHSIDILFMEILTCFFWCNPFLWLYKKAVAENHEFLADAKVVQAGTDLTAYSHELVQTGNKHKISLLISGFNFNLTKNRINMLYKKRSSKTVLALKTGMVLALFSFVFSLTACSPDSETGHDPFVVVVDPGHGGKDPGSTNEKQINLQVAKKLEALGQEGNIEIILTRQKDVFVSLAERVNFTKKQNADLFLSLHCNFSNDIDKRGVVVYYARNDNQKKQEHRYSKILVSNYLEEIAAEGEISTVGFFVLREQEIPAVMLELGFLSNKQESKQLNNPKHQQAIAETIYKSLLEIEKTRN